LIHADLVNANLYGASFRHATLTNADLSGAILAGADFRGATLIGTRLGAANLINADLRGATFRDANLEYACLIDSDVEAATFDGCRVHGLSAWGLRGSPSVQSQLLITKPHDPKIFVDNLEVAQFVYLLLYNPKIRHAIDTITSKLVLILGRFSEARKEVLDALRDELRRRNLVPVIFDFEKPARQNLTATVSTLAHMARFIIADITDPRSIPQELQRVVPFLTNVPIQPIIHGSEQENVLLRDF